MKTAIIIGLVIFGIYFLYGSGKIRFSQKESRPGQSYTLSKNGEVSVGQFKSAVSGRPDTELFLSVTDMYDKPGPHVIDGVIQETGEQSYQAVDFVVRSSSGEKMEGSLVLNYPGQTQPPRAIIHFNDLNLDIAIRLLSIRPDEPTVAELALSFSNVEE